MINQGTFIHSTAIIEKGVELDTNVYIGPYCVISNKVKIAKNTKLHSHIVINGQTTIGENNEIFSFASIGNSPQDLKYKGENTELYIGNDNKIRENVTINLGTVQGGAKTVIGNNNLFMAYAHVAHDCLIGDDNVFANSVALAGHVIVHNKAVFGGLSAVTQFHTIGDLAMLGAGSILVQDLPPFAIAEGERSRLRGLNIVAMKRRGFSSDNITNIRKAYKFLFFSNFPTIFEAINKCELENLHNDICVQNLIAFIKKSKGVVRPHCIEKINI